MDKGADMTNMTEIDNMMEMLEREAHAILINPNLTPFERRHALAQLFLRHHVLEEYKAALAAFIAKMNAAKKGRSPPPEEIARKVIKSAKFTSLNLPVLAAFIAVTYEDGPKSHWVPSSLLPSMTMTGPVMHR
jgi:hypothetical protein